MCVAVWTPLLLYLLLPAQAPNQEKISPNNHELGGDRVLSREHYYLFYRSIQNE
ncbi:hypothetical protein [Scytonema sp. NUACC21]